MAMQYVGDVITNIYEDKKGIDIFIPSLSIGDYFVAGITSLLPGKGIINSFVQNSFSEVLIY